MSDQANAAEPVGGPTVEFATVDEVKALDERVSALEEKGSTPVQAPPSSTAPEGVENVVNEGENLERTATNPELDPHQPGVEPEDAPVNSGVNAPASTDPGGDTAKQNAPGTTAPEPDGPNVATNPGTDSTSDAQTEVPQPGDDSGATPAVQPAAKAGEKPLYVYVGDDPNYTAPAGYVPTSLQTPDGKPLYHYTDDTAGEPHTGGVDGELGIYADDVVVAQTEESTS